MKKLFFLMFTLATIGCSQEDHHTTVKDEILKRWSISDSAHVKLFDFSTISEFDEYQYLRDDLFDSAKVILPVESYGIELIPEGNKLKNDLLCVIPLPEDRFIRFQFSRNGNNITYQGKAIKPEETKEIIIERLLQAKRPNQTVISLIFEDSIKQEFVTSSVQWMNDGFLAFVTQGLSPSAQITNFGDLDQCVRDNLERYRLIYGIGRKVDLGER